jgi:hypothetical protein
MVLLALRGYVELHLKMVKLGVQDTINWTTIEKEVSFSFGIKQEHVNDLREEFLISGQVIVREKHAVEAEARDVEAVQEIPVMRNRSKLLPHHPLSLCQWVDKQHSEGRSVTNSKAHIFIHITFEINVTQRSVRRYFARLGLSWQKIKTKKHTLDGYHIDAIRDF